MAQFTTRVELHDADGADYEALHEYMLAAKFYRTIVGSDGVKYKMPTAEYDSVFDLTASQVCDLAQATASKTGKKLDFCHGIESPRLAN